MMNDYDFLYALDSTKARTVYARVTLLNFDESPIEAIEGKITSGSINVDGASAVRRSCSFSMVAAVIDTSAYSWGLHSKFSFEVGLENPFYGNPVSPYSTRPRIIWFKQGIFVCTSYSSSISPSGYTINLQGEDKMCLLNGDIGGTLTALSTDFGQVENISYEYEEQPQVDAALYRAGKYYYLDKDGKYKLDTGNTFMGDRSYYKRIVVSNKEKIWIGDIIRELVHVYGNEPYNNILINDIEQYGVELWEYRGDQTLFMVISKATHEIEQLILDDETQIRKITDESTGKYELVPLYTLLSDDSFKFASLNTLSADSKSFDNAGFSLIGLPNAHNDSKEYGYLLKFDYGDLVGYHQTLLTYPGELTAAVGSAITGVLDNITKIFGNFEYFYDLDGHFVFQKKRSIVQTTSTGLVSTYEYLNGTEKLKDGVIFNHALMDELTSYNFQNSELFTQMSITPQITKLKNDFSVWGTRDAVDGKSLPVHYRFLISERPVKYTSIRDGQTYYTSYAEGKDPVDWRELIYQMALDYYEYNTDDNFLYRVGAANPVYYPTGYTGYEMLYSDMQAFWRQIYKPENQWVMEQASVTEKSFASMKSELYVAKNGDYYHLSAEEGYDANQRYYRNVEKSTSDGRWHIDVKDNPTAINFWLDFCDSGELARFSVQNMGDRPKAVNDSTVKSIYYEEAPNVLLVFPDELLDRTMTGYTYLTINRSMQDYFTIASTGKSAKEALTAMLNESAFITESATFTSVPIYYLDVNTKIQVVDSTRGINGEYLVSKLTIPLTYNGTMSITATNIIDNIY